MTPKQVARSLVPYGKKNPELNMPAFVIPQVPGAFPQPPGRRRGRVTGQEQEISDPPGRAAPEVTGGVIVAYLADGRLKLPKGTPVFEIGDEESTNAPRAFARTGPQGAACPVA